MRGLQTFITDIRACKSDEEEVSVFAHRQRLRPVGHQRMGKGFYHLLSMPSLGISPRPGMIRGSLLLACLLTTCCCWCGCRCRVRA